MTRQSDYLLRWTVFFGLALGIITAIAAVLIIRSQVAIANSVPNLDSLPSLQLTRAEAELNEALVELRKADMNVQSTSRAIVQLNKGGAGDDSRRPEAAYARAYLLKHEVPESERRWLVYMLISTHSKLLNDDDFKLLEKYGRPSDGPALARKIPPRACVPQWFALLDKWQTPLDRTTLSVMFFLDLGVELRRELQARKNWPNPDVLAAILESHRKNPGLGSALGLLDDADARAVRIAALLSVRAPPQPEWIDELVANPPSPAARALLVESLTTEFGLFQRIEQLTPYLPLLESWNEPALTNAAEQLVSREIQNGRPTVRLELISVTRCAAVEQLVRRYERHPSEPLGRLLAALGPPRGDLSLWSVAEFARRRSDLAKQAGIVMTDPTAAVVGVTPGTPNSAAGTGDATGGAAGTSSAARPIDVSEALVMMQTGDKARVINALEGLSVTTPDEARRSEVLSAITVHFTRNDDGLDAARLAYCHWAGPNSLSIVENMAISSRTPAVQAAVVRALVRLGSDRLHIVARFHMASEPWTPELVDAWAASKEAGEEALCGGMIAMRAMHPPSKDAIAFLGNHGGSRSLTVLKNLAADPRLDRSAIDSAIKKLETRLKRIPGDLLP